MGIEMLGVGLGKGSIPLPSKKLMLYSYPYRTHPPSPVPSPLPLAIRSPHIPLFMTRLPQLLNIQTSTPVNLNHPARNFAHEILRKVRPPLLNQHRLRRRRTCAWGSPRSPSRCTECG